MKTVSQLLQAKGHDIFSVPPHATVERALRLMAENNVGALLVLEGSELRGIFSERDYARKVFLKGRSSRDTPVRDIMTTRVYYIELNRTIEDCMALMTDKRIRHLPVFDGDTLVGVISIGDVVKAIISEQEFLIEQMENYITGTR